MVLVEEQIKRLEGERKEEPALNTRSIADTKDSRLERQEVRGWNSAIDQQIQYWSSQRDEIKKLISPDGK